MRRVQALRALALSSALILALSGTGCANEEDTSDTGELPSAEASQDAEEEADETSSPAETPDTEASEAEEE